jgi:ATP/maltotriose-dependent transcriptional regulator MalT
MINTIPPSLRKQHQFATESTRVKANMLMSQGRFSESLRLASRALSEFSSSMRLSMSVDFEITAAMSHLNLGHLQQAQNLSEDALKKAQQDRAPETTAFAELAESAIQTAAGDPQRAVSLARAANKFFSEKQKRESEWISLLCLAKALRKSGDSAGSRQAALEAQEVMSQIERAWGEETFKNYASRPDIARAKRDLSTLTRL